MSRDLSDVIARLSASIAAGDKNPHYRRAAAITGGVPVYADMGGILVVARDGTILALEHDDDRVTRETEARWYLLALAIAGRTHPELADLYPRRPLDAQPCQECGGSGTFKLPGLDFDLNCGACYTLGWVTM